MSKSTSPGTPRPERLGFPRAARVRLSREFVFVRRKGRSVHGRLLRVTAARVDGETRFGLVTSRRVGGAVVRNRVRRRLREICRLHRPQVLPGWLVVVSAKSSAAAAAYEELREEWLLLIRQLSILPRS
ncbi:MAG: ribonuclease P protein component [Terrimicrobiaceae bacterium]